MNNTKNIDLVHFALVTARNETAAVCDELLDAGVPWASSEYQAARKANSEATAAVVAYSKAKNSGVR